MISILIPIYNYNAVPLIKELQEQCMECSIDYEIVCIDDCSSYYKDENNTISDLEKCSLLFLDKNSGRSKVRNLLASKAAHEWILFIDCDTFPKNKFFIASYLKQIEQPSCKATFGGLDYVNTKPNTDRLLRWVYGLKREVKTVAQRQVHPYNTSYVSNFLIQKSVFASTLFDESITSYGFEDAIFIQSLKTKNVAIDQIENPVYHLNLESSELFLSKTKEALQTLLFLKQSNIKLETKLLAAFNFVNNLKLTPTITKVYNHIEPVLEKNLLSEKPSMILFDVYKIGYFCSLNNK